ncbi:MAG: DNA-binding protein [Clostridia bacterium]|nr:DNA-binding protein [Clostridia bacterium]
MAKDLFIAALLDVYGAFLSEKQREIMGHYYNDDLSLAEIAENEGTTRQAVSDIIRRGEALIKKYENGCGYYKKISEIKKICESDADSADKVVRISEIADNFL